MRNETYQAIIDLKENIKSSEAYITLLEKEKVMENNEEVISLAYQVDIASSEYSEILKHFKEGSHEEKEARHKLYVAKKALDEHPLVKDYLAAYQRLRIMLEEINDILFKDISLDLCKKNLMK